MTEPTKKPFCVEVKISLFYEIPAEALPEWAVPEGVEQMVEAALANFPHRNQPLAFGKDGILKMDPVEISINSVMA